MERKDKQTSALLETIQRELNCIIDEESETHSDYKILQTYTQSEDSAENVANGKTQAGDSLQLSSETSRPTGFIEREVSKKVDEDLEKVQLDLKQSYELFQTIGDRLENINFTFLTTRIRDLHLSAKGHETTPTTIGDLKDIFEKSYLDNHLHELTKEVGAKFRMHPGEFGDMPEISEFFKACSQLQHGLESLKKQYNQVQDLSRRLASAAEVSYDRVNEIQATLNIEPEMND